MKELIAQINGMIDAFKVDLDKSESNKAAGARARKASLELEKLFKEYRKVSVAEAKK